MSSEIHVNDIGTQFIITIKDGGSAVDISSSTDQKVYIKKPNTTTLEKDASFLTDGTDGKIEYIAVAGDLDSPGNYKIQAKIEMGGSVYYSSSATFKVHCNI